MCFASSSALSMTMQFGTPAANSCTWPGPTQTATRFEASQPAAQTSESRSPVSISTPFMHSTKILSRRCSGSSSRIRPRSPCELTEMMMTSLSAAPESAVVSVSESGIVTSPFERVSSSACILAEPARP